MEQPNKITSKLYKDTLWYMLGTALPMITLLLRTPIYTRIYSPELFGLYSIVYITFNYVASISYQWITNNVWRYYIKYKDAHILDRFWGTTFFLYLVSALFVIIGSSLWHCLSHDNKIKELILYGCLYFLTNEFLNTLLIPRRIEGKAQFYNLLNSSRHVLSFLLLLKLTFWQGFEIEAFFIAPLIINSSIILILIFTDVSHIRISFDKDFFSHINRFIKFGFGNLVFNIGIFLLMFSDRYIIMIFADYSEVGIYNQTYNLSQITIAALFSVFNAALNPVLIPKLENNPNNSDSIIIQGFYFAYFIFIPLTIIASVFSKEINSLLLGKEFREAWNIMPFIFISSFLAGINHFAIIKLKFQNRLKQLMYSSLIAALINIVLNLIFIPWLGYKYAAMTTLVAYIFLNIYLFFSAKLASKILHNHKWEILFIFLISISFIVYNKLIIEFIYVKQSIISAILKTLIFTIIYFLATKKISPSLNEKS